MDVLDSSGTYTSVVLSMDMSWGKYRLQNGYMSFSFLETTFFGYDMSAPNAVYQGNYPMTSQGTVRGRTQKVTFPQPTPLSDFALVKTGVGTGEIENIEYKLKPGSAEADLKLPTEDE